MKKSIRFILFSVISLLLSMVFLLLSGWIFLSTESGSKIFIQQIEKFIPGKLTIAKINGSLMHALTLENIQYRYDQDYYQLALLELNWRLAFERRFIQIQNLTLRGLQFKIAASSSTQTAAASEFSSPFPAIVKKILFHHLNMRVSLSDIKGEVGGQLFRSAIQFTYVNGELKVAPSYLQFDRASIEVAGSIAEDGYLSWKLIIPEIRKITPDAAGSISATGKISGAQSRPVMESVILAKNIRLTDYMIPLITLRLSNALNEDQLSSHFIADLGQENKAIGDITLINVQLANYQKIAVHGKIQWRFPQLAFLLKLIPEIQQPRGLLLGQADISGKLAAPQFKMNASLQDGNVFIPLLGIQLQQINLSAQAEMNQPLYFSGKFISGAGSGNLQGKVEVNQADLPVEVELSGNNLAVMRTKEYQINASPNIKLAYTNSAFNLQGTIDIPYAAITPADFSSVVTLPDEVVFVKQSNKPAASTLATHLTMNIKLILGDEIKVDYANLHARLAGQLRINKMKNNPMTGTGELYIAKGQYLAYGQLLTIDKGNIIYIGNPLTNPGLNVRATKKIKRVAMNNGNDLNGIAPVYSGAREGLVGVEVTGTLNAPRLTLFSEPAGMSQNDIISYLLFGYPQSNISSASSLALLNSVAANVNSDGKNVTDVVGKMQKKLGLSEFNIGSTEYFDPTKNSAESTTTVTVGKQLGKRLSVHYSVGIFQSLSILNLRYQIGKYLTVQTESSTLENGGDLLYEYERD